MNSTLRIFQHWGHLVTAALLMLLPGLGVAADNFANAEDSPFDTWIVESNHAATSEPAEPTGIGYKTIWRKFTTTQRCVVTVKTPESPPIGINHWLTVFRGDSYQTLNLVESAQGVYGGASVSFPAEAGMTFRICLGSFWSNESANMTFAVLQGAWPYGTVNVIPPPAPTTQIVGNDSFETAQTIPANNSPATVFGYLGSATTQPNESTFVTGTHAVWHSWQAPFNGTMRITSARVPNVVGFGHRVSVFTGNSSSSLTQVATDRASDIGTVDITFSIQANTNYRISVGFEDYIWSFGQTDLSYVLELVPTGSGIGSSSTLAHWNFSELPGDQTSTLGSASAAELSVGAMARGPGVTAASGFNSMNASGWTTANSRDISDYYQFSLTFGSGFEGTVESIHFAERRSSTGPRMFHLTSSLDNHGSAIGGVINVPDDTLTRQHEINLPANFADLQGEVVFRLHAYAAEASGGTWRISNHSEYQGLAVLGSQQAVVGGFDSWIESFESIPIALRGKLDDADQDGLSNLVEYFQGTSPADGSDRAGVIPVSGAAPGTFAMRYRRSKSAAGVLGNIRWSNDMTTWHASGESDGVGAIVIQETVVENSPETEELEAVATRAGSMPVRLFFSLEVSEAAP